MANQWNTGRDNGWSGYRDRYRRDWNDRGNDTRRQRGWNDNGQQQRRDRRGWNTQTDDRGQWNNHNRRGWNRYDGRQDDNYYYNNYQDSGPRWDDRQDGDNYGQDGWTTVQYGNRKRRARRRKASRGRRDDRGMARAPPASSWGRTTFPAGRTDDNSMPVPPPAASQPRGSNARSYAAAVRGNLSDNAAGQQQTDPQFGVLVRKMYSVIKLLHHLRNVTPNSDRPKPPMIERMVETLTSMVKPAYPTLETLDLIRGNALNWGCNTLLILEQHYDKELDKVLDELRSLKIANWGPMFEVAVRRARSDLPRVVKATIEHAEALITTTEPEVPLPDPSGEPLAAPSRVDAAQQTSQVDAAQQTSQVDAAQQASRVDAAQQASRVDAAQQTSPVIQAARILTRTHARSPRTRTHAQSPRTPTTRTQSPRTPTTHTQSPCTRTTDAVQQTSPVGQCVQPHGWTPSQHSETSSPARGQENTGMDYSPLEQRPRRPPRDTHTRDTPTRDTHMSDMSGDSLISHIELLEQAAGFGFVDPGLSVIDVCAEAAIDEGTDAPARPLGLQLSTVVADVHREADSQPATPGFTVSHPVTSTPNTSRDGITRHAHTNRKMVDWDLVVRKKWLVIGDSNLNRIPGCSVPDLQVDGYPGANFRHAQALLLKARAEVDVEHLVLSFGLNCKHQRVRETTIKQMQAALRAGRNRFPDAQIWIPMVNFSSRLPQEEQRTLTAMNLHIDHHMPRIPLLEDSDFATEQDNVHWTKNTARAMLAHWAHFLNLIPQ